MRNKDREKLPTGIELAARLKAYVARREREWYAHLKEGKRGSRWVPAA
jgi:hypothetical protein